MQIQYRLFAAVLSTASSVALCYVNFADWKLPPGVTFALACGFRVDNAATAVSATVALMALFYLGPLAASTLLVSISCRYAVGFDGSLRQRDRPLSLLTSLRGHLARYIGAHWGRLKHHFCFFLFIPTFL